MFPLTMDRGLPRGQRPCVKAGPPRPHRFEDPDMKLTRRQLAAAALAPVAAAQTAPAPSGPEQELQAARDTVRRNAEALAKCKLPPETEPAFQFKA